MECGDGLLRQTLDRYGKDPLVAMGFQQGQAIGVIGLVAQTVAAGVLGGKKQDPVAQALEQSPPVVGRAAGFHQNGGGRAVGEEASHLATGHALALTDPARLVGNRNLEDRLCKIHGDGRRMFHGLLLSRAAMTPNHSGTLMPFTWQEESISSLQRTLLRQGSGGQARSVLARSPLNSISLGVAIGGTRGTI